MLSGFFLVVKSTQTGIGYASAECPSEWREEVRPGALRSCCAWLVVGSSPSLLRCMGTKKPEAFDALRLFLVVKSTQTGTRTQDQLVKSQLLYQLSYLRFFVGFGVCFVRPFERRREIVRNVEFGKTLFHFFSFFFLGGGWRCDV